MIFLLVEDEFPTRQELRFTLEQLLPEATFYEATNGDEALTFMSRIRPDVVFLDINMPQRDGLSTAGLLAEMPDAPLIVFATAYDEHALKAFELAALDYVVKPFSKRRLEKTVIKIRQRLGEQQKLEQQNSLIQRFLNERPEPPKLEKLWVIGDNENRLLIPYTQISYIEARDKQVFVNLQGGAEHITRYTLKELEERLDAAGFCRCHKGYLVNLAAVAELIPWFSGGYQLKMDDVKESIVPVSRRHVQQVKGRLG
ncbi:MAG: LytTR family DNA-binding domain-containing protein [Chloroflexota bacterium]